VWSDQSAAEVKVFVCSCFGITEQQVRDHAAAGACTPRDIASQSKAGTDCGSCVRRIQGLLGRGECARREALRQQLEQDTRLPSVTGADPAPLQPAAA
jgi:bacterioferritin-associated ferredoxin